MKSKSAVKKKNKRKVNKIKVKTKNYSLDAVQSALQAVNEGISYRKAADTYGVPVATIFRKKKDPKKINSKTGPSTVLSEYEEQEIVNWIIYRAERGYPITKTELLDSVQAYIIDLKKENPFKENRPGRHWYDGFKRRHPNISNRTAQHLTLVRASVTEEDLREWFCEIEKYLKSKNLLDIDPSRIFNCDETNMQLCPKPEKVLAEKGARSVYKVIDANEKESLTALFMYNAAGTRAPPMVLYSYAGEVPKKVLENFPSGWGIGISDTGWMTAKTFYEYITNVFYPWLLKQNIQFPVIVYLDNHSSHVTIPLVSFCRQKQIELIALYPNSTHVMQPLDIAVFHPFKDVWKKTVPKWKVQNNVMRLRKQQFAAVLKMTLDEFTEEKKIVKNGFKAVGLMPFDPNAVDYNVLSKKNKKTPKENHRVIENQQSLENQQLISNASENKNLHLTTFENNLSFQLLQDFKNAESSKLWTGSIDKKGLFEYWLQIKKETFGIHIN